MKAIKDFLTEWPLLNAISLLGLVLYISGFLVWNFYLYTLGFIDDSFLQAKFILTGLTFCLTSFFLFCLVYLPGLLFRHIYHQYRQTGFLSEYFSGSFEFYYKALLTGVGITCLLLWMIIYSSVIFPYIPQLLGGGQPRAISFIVEEKSAEILNSFGIVLGEGEKYQTPPTLCIVHENSGLVFVALEDRILALYKSLLTGYVSLPGPKQQNEQKCIFIATEWSKKGLLFSLLLVETNFENLLLAVFDRPYRKGFIAQ
mgnify:CR=1 FL=1